MAINDNNTILAQNNALIETLITKASQISAGGGSGQDEGVKLFASVDEMMESVGNKEGDLAVVYANADSPLEYGNVITAINFPQTVVLDEPVTEETYSYADISVEGSDTSLTFFIDTYSGARLEYYDMDNYENMCSVTYNTTDYKTFTLDSMYGEGIFSAENNTIKCTTNMTVNMIDDITGKFLRTIIKEFGGLFRYESNQWIVAPSQLKANASDVYEKEFYGRDGIETGTLQETTNLSAEQALKVGTLYNQLSKIKGTGSWAWAFRYYEGESLPEIDATDIEFLNDLCANAKNLKSITLKNITSKCINAPNMFTSCSKLAEINGVETWDVSKVENISGMLYGCSSLTHFDFSYLDCSSTNSLSIFTYNCTNLTGVIDLSRNTFEKLEWCGNAFGNCAKITKIDMSNANPTSLKEINAAFSGCTALQEIDISKMDFSHVTKYQSIFNGVPTNCKIYVKDQATVDLLTQWDNTHTYTIKS